MRGIRWSCRIWRFLCVCWTNIRFRLRRIDIPFFYIWEVLIPQVPLLLPWVRSIFLNKLITPRPRHWFWSPVCPETSKEVILPLLFVHQWCYSEIKDLLLLVTECSLPGFSWALINMIIVSIIILWGKRCLIRLPGPVLNIVLIE